ncbi:MAG: peptide chain release factor 2 [Gammaproteobacteria bacterium]|nr:peptide chain release factor 2 [Gammaproteobacteria bacterium]
MLGVHIQDLKARIQSLSEFFEFEQKKQKLCVVEQKLSEPAIWNFPEKAQALSKERSILVEAIALVEGLNSEFTHLNELWLLLAEEPEGALVAELATEVAHFTKTLESLEFKRMMRGARDHSDAFMDIQSGAGGTEAQDWANMLLRMYLRFGERHGFKTEILSISEGEVAGIKNVSLQFEGAYAYGWLRTETGIHRLVRKSPFNASGQRHTSFASVFIYPAVSADIEVEINPADLRIDTYRAGGAGGQHVNKTDSAVRITHAPTGIVVQCQSDRSQHKNKSYAMKQLRAKLYEAELEKRNEQRQLLEAAKADITWGNQIRSYVLDASRIKDLRTGVEVGDTTRILDGDLDLFIEASLKSGTQRTK